ncbi:MIP/aquaporin family protein [Modestobacter sp. SYSU DS0875]
MIGALAAELLGSWFYIWMGTGAVLATAGTAGGEPVLDITAVSVAFAFAVLAAVYVTGPISGGHLNPAVTVALAAVRRFPWRAVPAYVVAQLLGAVLAALTNWALFGGRARADLLLGATTPGDRGAGVALLAEIALTLALLLTVMATAIGRNSVGPLSTGLAIGFVVGAGIFTTINVSGGSFNPVRTLGPMIVAGAFPGWWVYVVGPLVGAVLGAVVWERVLQHGSPPEVER